MGMVVLEGGGPFVANDILDSRVLKGLDGDVAVLLTAEAFENPEVLKASAEAWSRRIGISIVACDVYSRADARETHHARTISSACAVILAGDSSIHLRSTLLNTPVWEAIVEKAETGVVIGVGNCASALCDPMIDPRGGALGLGLGLVNDLSAVVEVESMSEERLRRTRQLATSPLAEIPTGSALVKTDTGWTTFGPVSVHGFQVGAFVK
jgi:cyanophycinase